jgi:hypothetical protein
MEANINLESMFEAVKAELIRLLTERDDLVRRRAQVDQQLTGLKQTITGLLHYSRGQYENETAKEWSVAFKALLDRVDDASPALTLTEACRRAFRVSRKPLSAMDVKAYLEAAGYDFENYKSNPLSSIHTVLKRLVTAGDIILSKSEGTTAHYENAPPIDIGKALANVNMAVTELGKLDLSAITKGIDIGIGKSIDFTNLTIPTTLKLK